MTNLLSPDGIGVNSERHSLPDNHIMYEGICRNCGTDDDDCECGNFACACCGESFRDKERMRHRCKI